MYLCKYMLCVCVYVCVCVCRRCSRRPEEGVDPLELESQVVVGHLTWVLGPNGCSEKQLVLLAPEAP